MLEQLYGKAGYEIISAEAFHLYPKAAERKQWDGVNPAIRNLLIQKAEKYLGYRWETICATDYLEFSRNGNRSRFETKYFNRRKVLDRLVLGECAEGKGRFLDDIINGIYLICDECAWVIPASNFKEVGKIKELPDEKNPIIDLFTAETGSNLAWIYYLLKEQLDAVSPIICERIRTELKRRIITPYVENVYWWMGLDGRHVNNWNPWCTSNCLSVCFIIEEDEAVRRQFVQKALRSLSAFIDGYREDGGCDEGVSYWKQAPGSLLDCLELLKYVTYDEIDIYNQHKIKNMAEFPVKMNIQGLQYVAFADAHPKNVIPPYLLYRFGTRVGSSALIAAARENLAEHVKNGFEHQFVQLIREIPLILHYDEIEAQLPGHRQPAGNGYLENLQIATMREAQGGFYLAMKGGSNAESHNHNDVGSFIIYYNGNPQFIDPSVESYTAKTFDSRFRYTLWTMRSGYHNIPVVNGKEQKEGAQFHAADAVFAESKSACSFSCDIARAYEPEAGLAAWKRTATMAEGNIIIEEQAEFEQEANRVSFIFMSVLKPVIAEPGVLKLEGGISVRFSPAMKAEIERRDLTDPIHVRDWGNVMYRTVLSLEVAGKELKTKFLFEKEL